LAWQRQDSVIRWTVVVGLCVARARRADTGGGSGSLVAVNGTILEQSQILTSHNLAVLIDAVGLRDPST